MGYELTEGSQGICPIGWHLPTDSESCTLEQFVDPTISCTSTDFRGIDGGGKLKETGTDLWLSPITGATNSTGFTAIPGSRRSSGDGSFYIPYNGNARFWSSTSSTVTYKWYRRLSYSSAQVYRGYYNKNVGLSVRCLKD